MIGAKRPFTWVALMPQGQEPKPLTVLSGAEGSVMPHQIKLLNCSKPAPQAACCESTEQGRSSLFALWEALRRGLTVSRVALLSSFPSYSKHLSSVLAFVCLQAAVATSDWRRGRLFSRWFGKEPAASAAQPRPLGKHSRAGPIVPSRPIRLLSRLTSFPVLCESPLLAKLIPQLLAMDFLCVAKICQLELNHKSCFFSLV